MEIVLLIARILLAAVFAVASVAKLLDLPGSRKSLHDFGVPVFLASQMAWLLPVAELTCAIALLLDASAQWGAMGVSVLLVGFIAAIGISLARGRRPDCHCFGQLSSKPIGASTLVRNTVLLALASLVAWKSPEYSGWGSLSSLTSFEMAMLALAAALALGLALTLFFLFQMLQQNGRLLVRLEAVEKKLEINPDEKPVAGLPIGTPIPYAPVGGKPDNTFLLVFTESGCSACEALEPELAHWRTEYVDRLSLDVITNRETAQLYKVTVTPSAVLVASGRIASPLAEGVDAIRALVKQSTLPPPVKKGEPVPALRLPDLNGETVDLATLRGRRTLVLFWSPSCGFCQQMLDDVKKWERNRPMDAPELLVISSGSAEENRKQGFDSPVLLDQNFGAGNVLGAGGTPSAIIIDEQGIVASDIRVGATDVLALAGS